MESNERRRLAPLAVIGLMIALGIPELGLPKLLFADTAVGARIGREIVWVALAALMLVWVTRVERLRQMLFVGAMAVIRHAERNAARRPWLVQLLARRKAKVAAVALANKTARTIWALMVSGERYREPLLVQG